MRALRTDLLQFFRQLQIWEDDNSGTCYKKELENAIGLFLSNGDSKAAEAVYSAFCRCYWIGTQIKDNPFLQLLAKVREFESSSGKLVPGQRDHYVHSVNVFLLGIVVYFRFEAVRRAVDAKILDRSVYPDSYPTTSEEFLYRWGIASLFHDIAYPLEISVKQLALYGELLSRYPGDSTATLGIRLSLDISSFGHLEALGPLPEYLVRFEEKYPGWSDINLTDVIDLMARGIADAFCGISHAAARRALMDLEERMTKQLFIDHGYYGAIIVLRWYYSLVKQANWNPAYFYFPIVNSAVAILLHNYYRHVLMKEPFNLGPLSIHDHPMAFLLILCDELQEWNREVYGPKGPGGPVMELLDVICEDSGLRLLYSDRGQPHLSRLLDDKSTQISRILQLDGVLSLGMEISD